MYSNNESWILNLELRGALECYWRAVPSLVTINGGSGEGWGGVFLSVSDCYPCCRIMAGDCEELPGECSSLTPDPQGWAALTCLKWRLGWAKPVLSATVGSSPPDLIKSKKRVCLCVCVCMSLYLCVFVCLHVKTYLVGGTKDWFVSDTGWTIRDDVLCSSMHRRPI